VLCQKAGAHVVAVGKTSQSLGLRYDGATTVAPTSLYHEVVPNLDVLLTGSATVLKAPIQNLLVRASSKNALDECLVFDGKRLNLTPPRQISTLPAVLSEPDGLKKADKVFRRQRIDAAGIHGP